jgi:hypothetical protein
VPLAATATVMVVLTCAAGALQAHHAATPEPGEAAAAAEAAITRSGRDTAPPQGPHGEAHEVATGIGGQRTALHDEHPEVRARAVAELARSGDPRVLHDLVDALADQDAGVREAAAAAVGQMGNRSAIPALRQHLGHKDEDPWVRLRMAESLAALGERDGLQALLDLAATGDGGLLRLEALNTLSKFASLTPPVDDPAGDAAQKRLGALRAWWDRNGARLHFDPQTRTFH